MNSKNHIKINLVVFFLLFILNTSFSDYILKSKSIIDWQKGFIISKGLARITFNDSGTPVNVLTGEAISLNKAREEIYSTAKNMAIVNMTEAIKYIRVDPQNSLFDVLKNSPITQKKLAEKINKYISYKEYPADFVTSICEARLNFDNIIDSLNYDFPSHDFPVRAIMPVSTPYTGLIVDSRGMKIMPMLFPSIYSEAGLEIYGRNFIDISFSVNGGVASYCHNEDQARTDARAGEHPYFATAIKSINDCPVLSKKDVRRILSSQSTINNLKKCRVIFIIDREEITGN